MELLILIVSWFCFGLWVTHVFVHSPHIDREVKKNFWYDAEDITTWVIVRDAMLWPMVLAR